MVLREGIALFLFGVLILPWVLDVNLKTYFLNLKYYLIYTICIALHIGLIKYIVFKIGLLYQSRVVVFFYKHCLCKYNFLKHLKSNDLLISYTKSFSAIVILRTLSGLFHRANGSL